MLRVSEIYPSVQGEGPHVGMQTTFVRFAGCNMRCPGWPCDTPYAIFPRLFKDDSTFMEVGDIMNKVVELVPRHICITGGEPTIQNKSELSELGEILLVEGFTIDLFTNGTRTFPSWTRYPDTSVIMDWKLPGSGEYDTLLDQRRNNRRLLMSKDAVKFVLADHNDFLVADELVKQWKEQRRNDLSFPHKIYFAPAWGKVDPKHIVEWMGTDPDYLLNLQMHKYIYEPDQRGI